MSASLAVMGRTQLDANTSCSRLHRGQPRRARGRAHLACPARCRCAGGPEHLRGQEASCRRRGHGATRPMTPIIAQPWEDSYRVYCARKLWKAANRTGYDIGRDQVAVSAQCRPSPGP